VWRRSEEVIHASVYVSITREPIRFAFRLAIFFRRLQVGQVTSYALDPDGVGVTFHVFVNAPYDKYVNRDTRFWHASGVDVTLDTSGVKGYSSFSC
jgi:hypothetical protein